MVADGGKPSDWAGKAGANMTNGLVAPFRMLRRAAGTAGAAAAALHPPGGEKSATEMPPWMGLLLFPSRASMVGPKSVRKLLPTNTDCSAYGRTVARAVRSSMNELM